jgi:murein L,D-transpeptidase YcbB/YkuD
MHRQVNFSWPRRWTLASTSALAQCVLPEAGVAKTAPFKSIAMGSIASLLLLASASISTSFADETASSEASVAAPSQDGRAETPSAARAEAATPASEPEKPTAAASEGQSAGEKPVTAVTQSDSAAPNAPAPVAEEPKKGSVSTSAASTPASPASSAPEASAPDKAASDSRPAIDQDLTASIHAKASAGSEGDATQSAAPAQATEATAPAILEADKFSPKAAGSDALPGLLQAALEKLVFADVKGQHAAETLKIRESLAAFYTQRNFAPLWTADGHVTPAAHSVIDRLNRAPDDGLDLVALPDLTTGNDADRVAADIALSEAVVAYGRAASGSRVDPKAISGLIGEKPDVAEPLDILTAVANAGETGGDALQNFNPPQKSYAALRDKLAELRHAKPPLAQRPIPSGPELTVGMRDPRVTLIRARFGLDVQQASAPEELVYDTKVAAAVAGFQKTMGLPASGVLTARTIAALSGGQPSRLENEILANMERWRWMPRDMGETYIAVNIPDFTVSVIKDDHVLTQHRVVVGKPDTPTPVFSNKMQYLIVNPYWNVPQSIIRKEFLPKGGGDLSYLSAAGWQVSSHHGQLVVRQPPGEKNALGHIKFLFPNDYSVYLHDTPSRSLFASAKRAFSHGCVRVDQPFSFAETVLNHGWSEQRLKSLIGTSERYINLPTPLPIHIEYFTTYVDETGRLQMRDDLYGYSHRVKAALGLEG